MKTKENRLRYNNLMVGLSLKFKISTLHAISMKDLPFGCNPMCKKTDVYAANLSVT